MKSSCRSGFTLVELSIVLVIIGLVIGGILAGKDLIEASNMRATVAQFREYDSAVNAFKLKYNCLPGDCAQYATYGFTLDPLSICSGCTLGDGAIDESSNNHYGEARSTWIQLAEAGLIASADTALRIPHAPLDALYPPVGEGWWIYPLYKIELPQGLGPSIGGLRNHVFALTAAVYASEMRILNGQIAYSLDSKMDDGHPTTGLMRGITGNDWGQIIYYTNRAFNADGCLLATAPVTYNFNASVPYNCAVFYQSSF